MFLEITIIKRNQCKIHIVRFSIQEALLLLIETLYTVVHTVGILRLFGSVI